MREHWPRYVILLAIVLFLILVRSILPPFVIAAVLAYIVSPAIGWMEKRVPLPRVAVVSLFFLFIVVPLVVVAIIFAPSLLRETASLLVRAPDILTSILVQLFGGETVEVFGQVVSAQDITDQILGALLDFLGQPSEALHVATRVLEAVLNGVLSLVLLFYFLVDRERFGRDLLLLLPEHARPGVRETAGKIHAVFGRYLRGLVFLIVLMAVVTWLGLNFLFHLSYALPIAIAAGFLEIIPLLGPVAAGAIAALVGLEQGGVSLAIWIIVYYIVVRQVEDQVVSPNVLGRAVELHPVVAIFAVLAGGLLAGIVGLMLAIPIAAAIKVAMDYWQLRD
ncbi:MAG: AI-2E family transporter [Chloroflexi bacterium]|nr:AI-2E family transporter [Chloroflexota bacterium]MDA8186923.1 AI-2E family transporter [Dehalococcoidales bacterium]